MGWNIKTSKQNLLHRDLNIRCFSSDTVKERGVWILGKSDLKKIQTL